VKRSLLCAIAIGGLTVSAQAADLSLDSVKDPIPDNLTWHGVTVYGVIDVGYGYVSNGNQLSGAFYDGPNYNLFGNSLSQGPQSTLTSNALSQSTIGIKIEENIGYGFQAIGKLDTGFNPTSGQLADACEALVEAAVPRAHNLLVEAGVPGIIQNIPASADGSRCGQAFNGVAYGGVSSPLYGTLTIGRQNSLVLDGTASYDPMALSYAMSILGYSGTPAAGIGSTETARWDDSIKYVFSYGPVHAAGMYADGSTGDTSIHGYGAGGNVGFTYKGLSVDAFYTYESGAVNGLFGLLPGLTALNGGVVTNNTNQLYYFLSDNSAWTVMGKYTFEFGDALGLKDGGGSLKDAPAPAPYKFTIFGGFNQTQMSNYNGTWLGQLGEPNGTTIGGYQLAYLNNVLLTTRELNTAWAGAKFETGPWAFTAAYYWFGQNSFEEANNIFASIPALKTGTVIGGCYHLVNAGACAGDINQVSFLIDYTFNKHFDVYTGVSYQAVDGGLAHSFLTNDPYDATNNTTVVSGLRVKF
jgi:predicted porin